mgnify:CR=1 FL=1
MEKFPKISIVTVVFNDVLHIENTILSVLSQTYKNIEYIIIDGGSTDGTVSVIKKYEDSLAYWITEPDSGIYDGMNKGIHVATGKWILFRNCGDYFSSRSDVEKVFDRDTYEGVDIIYGKMIKWDNWGYYIATPPLSIQKSPQKEMPVFHPSTFIRTSLQKSMPFDLRYKLAADHDFFYKCTLQHKKYQYVPYVLSIFDASEGASSNNQHLSIMEHYYIHGGSEENLYGILVTKYACIKRRLRCLMAQFMPKVIMARRRKKQGRTLWSEDFTINDMINKARTSTHTFF